MIRLRVFFGIIFSILILPITGASASFSYTQTLPSNTIYFDDFGNYVTPSPCTTAALACLPGWGAYDNATGGIANITTWHPLTSSGKSMLMGSSSTGQGKFDRHRSWAILPGQSKITISQWFQYSNNALVSNFPNRNEIHFSLEMVGTDSNFHECLIEYYPLNTASNNYIAVNDAVFNYNFTLSSYDRGGFASNPNALFANNQWHYEKITMDFTNQAAPTCPYMQMDNLIISSLTSGQGWVTTPSTPASYSTTSTSHANAQYLASNGYANTRPLRLEIAMITGNAANPQYFTWHTNILITDDSPGNPNIIQFGIVTASGLFQLILITTAMMYVSSGFGAVMRVFAKDKVPKFLGPKFIIITGVVGTAGFLFMLIVGANLVQPACPVGFTCSG